jgi:probable phosphoglycerate mutase
MTRRRATWLSLREEIDRTPRAPPTCYVAAVAVLERTIYLARHGETEWNRIGRWQGATDIPLSDHGRAQAGSLAERLRDLRIARVHASQLSRALETAQIVATRLALPAPISDPRLRERGYGAFEGLTRHECAERFPGVWERYLADRRVVPPGAEPQAEVVERITAVMTEIAGRVGDLPGSGAILVISHGGTIRSFVHAITGVIPPPLENGTVLRIGFAGGAFVSAEQM